MPPHNLHLHISLVFHPRSPKKLLVTTFSSLAALTSVILFFIVSKYTISEQFYKCNYRVPNFWYDFYFWEIQESKAPISAVLPGHIH